MFGQSGSSDDYCDAVYGPVNYDTETEQEIEFNIKVDKQTEDMSKKITEMFYDTFPSLTPEAFIVLTNSTTNVILSLALAIKAESRESFIEDFVSYLRKTFKKMNSFRRY